MLVSQFDAFYGIMKKEEGARAGDKREDFILASYHHPHHDLLTPKYLYSSGSHVNMATAGEETQILLSGGGGGSRGPGSTTHTTHTHTPSTPSSITRRRNESYDDMDGIIPQMVSRIRDYMVSDMNNIFCCII